MTLNIGRNIKTLRQIKGITQESLACVLGVTFQSVSKWERGETYPDITVLPRIAEFFSISVDELLGVNKEADDKEIEKLIEQYDKLTPNENPDAKRNAILLMREKYPGDFRVQLKYMEYLVSYEFMNIPDNAVKISSIYENICQNCTNDSIRIKAKSYYITYLCKMATVKDSGVTAEDYEKIISELPGISFCREGYCFLLHHSNNDLQALLESIETVLFEAYLLLSDRYFSRKDFSRSFQIEILEKTAAFFDYIYNDSNYSRAWKSMIFSCYGMLGWFYYQDGNTEKSVLNFKNAAHLAVKFDSLERFTTLHSTLFEGKIFDKHIFGSDFSAKKWLKKFLLEEYNLSDEFKNSEQFIEILNILE